MLDDPSKVVSAVCHGPASLLSAAPPDGRWLFEGREPDRLHKRGRDAGHIRRRRRLASRGPAAPGGARASPLYQHGASTWSLTATSSPDRTGSPRYPRPRRSWSAQGRSLKEGRLAPGPGQRPDVRMEQPRTTDASCHLRTSGALSVNRTRRQLARPLLRGSRTDRRPSEPTGADRRQVHVDQSFETGWGNIVYGVTPRGLVDARPPAGWRDLRRALPAARWRRHARGEHRISDAFLLRAGSVADFYAAFRRGRR